MQWLYQLGRRVRPDEPQVVNDSKTPSGRVHVGSLRGVLIHDAVTRYLREEGVPVRYLFGCDDYDPLDELPSGQEEFFRPYLGAPLCNVPPPRDSAATDMADHFISEFFQIFSELGVRAETYRMREVYRSGRFNEPIDAILRAAPTVRRIYLEVSNSARAEDWHPFQTVCEQCGRIGTTEVTEYDGSEVTYTCRTDLVKWAQGCGHRGKVSPFDGRGKLPWKLEWVAKWREFPVTIEGAGKDHTTRGGARDVAAACLKEIFGLRAPYNIPYEFFLVGGAKMSSSRGIGAAAREMADLLPPEMLRFQMLGTLPNRPVNFTTDEEYFVKCFNELDRLHQRAYDGTGKPEEALLYRLTEVAPAGAFFDAPFQLVLTLVQMPHVDLVAEIERRKGGPLTGLERGQLDRRIATARLWLERYAADDEKLILRPELPARQSELTAQQRALLHRLADALVSASWDEESIQTLIFDTARLTPIDGPAAFQAIYRVLFDRASGPKAGSILAYLDRDFVLNRFREVPHDQLAYLEAVAMTPQDVGSWLTKERARLATVRTAPLLTDGATAFGEVLAEMTDGRIHRRVVELSSDADLSALAAVNTRRA